MSNVVRAILVVATAWVIGPTSVRAATVLDVPLPSGARVVKAGQTDNLFRAPRGFRKTIDFYARFLSRRGLAHRAVPVYGYRGVVVARFVSEHPSTAWEAIHVFKIRGVTMIYIVPRVRLTSPAGRGKEASPERVPDKL